MAQKAFTLLEIIATIVIAAILATIALPIFTNILEDSKTKVCVTNVKTLHSAVEMYIMEHDVVPGSLSQLTPAQIEKAYAAILRERGGWKIRVARAIVDLSEKGFAFAQAPASYGMPILHCPKDTNGGISYGLNKNLVNQTSIQYSNLKQTSPATVLVSDADASVFTPGTALVTSNDRYHIHYGGASRLSFLIGISIAGKLGVAESQYGSQYNIFNFNPEKVQQCLGNQ